MFSLLSRPSVQCGARFRPVHLISSGGRFNQEYRFASFELAMEQSVLIMEERLLSPPVMDCEANEVGDGQDDEYHDDVVDRGELSQIGSVDRVSTSQSPVQSG